MVSPSLPIPIVIFIFDNNGEYIYRAYSPSNFNRPNNSQDNDYELLQQFITNVYNYLDYNPDTNSNITLYGRLLEMHIRFIKEKVSKRGDYCIFGAKSNQYTNYRPVYRKAPIYFNNNTFQNYIGNISDEEFERNLDCGNVEFELCKHYII
jgi:hypothetical protein